MCFIGFESFGQRQGWGLDLVVSAHKCFWGWMMVVARPQRLARGRNQTWLHHPCRLGAQKWVEWLSPRRSPLSKCAACATDAFCTCPRVGRLGQGFSECVTFLGGGLSKGGGRGATHQEGHSGSDSHSDSDSDSDSN